MKIDVIRVLDEWVELGDQVRITPLVLEQLRACAELLGVSDDFCSDVTGSNFLEKVGALTRKRRQASNALGAALLESREHEDVAEIEAAIEAFERFLVGSKAEGYRAIARSEIARLKRLKSKRR